MKTNGDLIVEPGHAGTETVIVSVRNLDMAISIFVEEIPWLVAALEETRIEFEAEAQRAKDAAALERWNMTCDAVDEER